MATKEVYVPRGWRYIVYVVTLKHPKNPPVQEELDAEVSKINPAYLHKKPEKHNSTYRVTIKNAFNCETKFTEKMATKKLEEQMEKINPAFRLYTEGPFKIATEKLK